jgi:hypothetical protein
MVLGNRRLPAEGPFPFECIANLELPRLKRDLLSDHKVFNYADFRVLFHPLAIQAAVRSCLQTVSLVEAARDSD